MAVDLETACRALADQIKGWIARDTNVDPFPTDSYTPPSITVYPPAEPIDYRQSMGPDSDLVVLRLKLEVDADGESMMVKIYDYLGVGTGRTSSIRDAVRSDPTLGGAVVDAAVVSAQIGEPDSEPGVAWLNVEVILKSDGGF